MLNRLLLTLLVFSFSTITYAESRRIKPLRIVGIEIYDQGNISEGTTPDFTIDSAQGLCLVEGEEERFEDEPFFDTFVGLRVLNNTDFPVRLKKSRFVIKNLNKQKIKSKKLFLPSVTEIDPKTEKRVLSFVFDAEEGRKVAFDKNGPLTLEGGATNVRFVLFGKDFFGKRVRVRGKLGLSFQDVDRCS